MVACGGASGTAAFGGHPFGSGFGVGITAARISALNAVEVTFSGPIRAFDKFRSDDALNTKNWTLRAFSPFNAKLRLIQAAQKLTDRVILIGFDGPLDEDATYELEVSGNVEDAGGLPIDPGCTTIRFLGLGLFRFPFETPKREVRTDINNPFLPRDAFRPGDALGTLQIDDKHDYQLHAGRSYLRKRVLRRATTLFGEFFHLPQYGFAESLKDKLTPEKLKRIEARAREQLLREPDVVSARVQVSRPRPNVVVVTMRIKDTNGEVDTMTLPIDIGEIQ